MKKKVIGILMLVVSTFSQGEGRKLTLEEAVKLSYKNSFTLKNADLDFINSKLKVKEAYKEALPKLDYTGDYSKNEMEIYGDQDSRNSSYSNKIELVQPIYRGGVIGAGIEAAKKVEERSDYEYLNKKSDLRLSVIEKYIEIIKSYKQLDVYKVSLREVEGELGRAERKYQLKLISKSKVLPFKTRVINTRTKIIQVKNQLMIDKVDLKNELKIPAEVKIDLYPIDEVRYNLSIIDIDTDVKSARGNNRDSQIARLNYEVTMAQEAQARADFLPKIDLRGGYTAEDGDLKGSGEDWQWNVGVSVEMNLFSFGQDMNGYERSKNETRKAKNLEAQARDNIEVQVRSKFLDLIKQEGTIAEQEVAVESAKENYSLEKKRYENGLTDVIDFLTIENSLREAELSLIQAELDYYLAYERYQESLK